MIDDHEVARSLGRLERQTKLLLQRGEERRAAGGIISDSGSGRIHHESGRGIVRCEFEMKLKSSRDSGFIDDGPEGQAGGQLRKLLESFSVNMKDADRAAHPS